MADSREEVQNREDDGKFWILVYPEKGLTDIGGMMIPGMRGKKVPLYTYTRVTPEECEHFRSEASLRRCRIFELAPGMSPRDIMVQGK